MIAALIALSGCGGKSPPMGPSLPEAPTLACPSNLDVSAPTASPIPVQFTAPVASGGQVPVVVSCNPAGGAAFPAGPTLVTCSARDDIGRTAACTFLVTVTPVPRLAVSRFVAFGDSITAGEIAFNFRLILDPTRSYPADLRTLLLARYQQQPIEVFNEGMSGERAENGARRISGVLDRRQPEVLLLLQGVVDISDFREAGIAPMIEALKFDIRDAARRNVRVMISTLLPQKRSPGCLCQRATAIDLIDDANDRIRDLAFRENVTLVDAWQAFRGREDTLIGDDGLHPTVEGYETLAQTFFEKIQSTFAVNTTALRR